jgi:hypothetical protein
MSDMWPDDSVGHEWEADQCPRCGSVPGMVNAGSHLWQVSLVVDT